MNEYIYHPMHMHIHTCFQPGSSMANHMHNAKQLGMKYIWFTDHDLRTGRKHPPVHGFQFDMDNLMKYEKDGSSCGFELMEHQNAAKLAYGIDTQKQQLTLKAVADEKDLWQSAGIYFTSSGTRHTASLLMDVCLNLHITAEKIGADARLILNIRLSQQPPECTPAHLLYVAGNTAGLAAPHTQILPLKIKNGTARLPLSKDVLENEEIGGRDNVFDTVSVVLQVRKKAALSVTLGNFEIEVKKFFEQARQEQMKEAKVVGKRYGVTPYVSFEISGAGEHKNCFSTHVPTIDYADKNFCISNEEAVRHVKSYGGIFAINHPLAINPLKRKTFSETQRSRIVAKMAAELLACKAYGADLIEVGFPCGRNGFSLDEYLMLWDLLSTGGLFLCGYGSSDSHRNNDGWFNGNNFATYLAAESRLPHPVPEEVFVRSMRRGMAYTGNPMKLKGQICFETAEGHQMGSVFDGTTCQKTSVVFRAEHTEPGWQFRLIENGNTVYTQELSGGAFAFQSQMWPKDSVVTFQRAELYDETGMCILLTNPIYIVKTEEAAFNIPDWRITKECGK